MDDVLGTHRVIREYFTNYKCQRLHRGIDLEVPAGEAASLTHHSQSIAASLAVAGPPVGRPRRVGSFGRVTFEHRVKGERCRELEVGHC
jgi:hypothetical protein